MKRVQFFETFLNRLAPKRLCWFIFCLAILMIPVLVSHSSILAAGEKGLEGFEIDRVDFLGVTAFSGSVLESRLEIVPGDTLSRQKVLATEKNILEMYVKHGYEGANVESRLVRKKGLGNQLETVLEFKVSEGKVVRIAKIEVSMAGHKDRVSGEAFRSKEEKMRAAIPITVGDVLERDKLDEGKRNIQELLASKEFVGGKISEVQVLAVAAPEGLALSETEKTATQKWVSIRYFVDVGERVNFGFRGNSVFTSLQLDNLVNDQRLLGLGKDYVSVIGSKIEDEYRALGYAQVRVTPYLFEAKGSTPRQVSFLIEEGARIRIHSVDFDGNIAFSSDELRATFFERSSGLVQHKFYVEKDLQKAGESLIEYLKENGYLSARLITMSHSVAPKLRGVFKDNIFQNVLFYIYEGDQTRVHSIQIDGNKALSRDELLGHLGIKENAPINLYRFSDGVEAIKRHYKNLGFLDVKINNDGTDDLVSYSQENRVADVSMDIVEGPQFKVGGVEIEGLSKTQEIVVRRELKFQIGDVLTGPTLEGSERGLRRLGIFANISFRVTQDPNSFDRKIVRISLVEAERGTLVFGPGLRNDLGIRGFGQFSFSNIWGLNHSVAVNLNINRRFAPTYHFGEGQLQIAYAFPWFGIRGVTFRPVLSAGRTQYIQFSADYISAAANFDKQLLSKPNLTVYLSYAFENITQFGAVQTSDNQQLRMGTVTPKVSIDLRDDPLSPKSGFYALSSFDYCSPVLGAQTTPFPISFYRFQVRSDYYFPLGRDVVWYLSLRAGHEASLEKTVNPSVAGGSPASQDAIPLIKQFTMGGVGSLRGFAEQSLNFQTTNIRGSLSYVNYRTQVDFPFAGSVRLALFLDAANLLVDHFSFWQNMRFGSGLGFHYSTPVGPVSLDLGINMDPKITEDQYQIHFSVGVL